MEIGRTPNIAPGPVADVTSSNKGQQATQLPEYQTVTPAARSESPQLTFREVPIRPSGQGTRDAQNAPDQVDSTEEQAQESRLERREREVRREIEVDRDTSALVFRAIEVSTGDVVQQYPEEARLNLRAYIEAEEAKQAEREAREAE